MRLLMSPMSPFARKVRVLARETGLADRLEEVDVSVTPLAANPQVQALNPLGKIPALLRQEGGPLYDSPVIAEYLDGLHPGRPRVPPRGEPRWRALRQQALADGLMDAAVLLRYETALRPPAQRWEAWSAGQQARIEAALDALDAEAVSLAADVFGIGGIATVCALGYLDFRWASLDWRQGREMLADWYQAQAERASVRETVPRG